MTTEAPAGSDPHPAETYPELAGEDRPEQWGDAPRKAEDSANDDRLRDNVPPHNVNV
ncbi:hypothetical protein [Gulosibacter sp. ACHW.36C]|uniref:Uncharacterized protein n=1 Tax=Gulosibacter sediminis TaxID=1729695 RepID=A0ABY4MYQ9_9MICO|nr:hypothetical protein [Gulosibacter sediminis]UQN15576.1 hypothetical protein M3M28_03710 [Gulosibacter sediminis]